MVHLRHRAPSLPRGCGIFQDGDDISISHPVPQLPVAEVQFLASVPRRLGLPSPTQPSLVGPRLYLGLRILRMLEPRLLLFVRQK